MEAYLVPLLAALAAAMLTAAVLGAVRLGRWWAAAREGGATAAPPPGAGMGGALDPRFPRLAHGALGAALLAGVAAIFFFAVPESAGARGIELPAAAAVLAAWAVTWGPR